MKLDSQTKAVFDDLVSRVPADEAKQLDYSFRVAERICEILKEKGISQRQLAALTGKRPSEISRWVSGQHNFTLSTLAKLSIALQHDFIEIV